MGSAVSSPSPTTIKKTQQPPSHLKGKSSLSPNTALTPSPNSTLLSNPLTNFIQQETHHIRVKILHDIPLSFTHPTIILLYGPPLSNCNALGSYIASKFNFCYFSPSDQLNHEELLERIEEEDCQKGFLLINLPQSVMDGEEFNLRTKHFKKVVLLLEQDFTKLLRSKCADWVHVPSGRRYHAMTNPPKSMKGTLDDVRNMYDDETAEPLEQVVDRREFRAELKVYSKMSTGMRTFYAHSLSTLSGDQSLEDLKRETVFTLCRVIANQPKLKGRVGTNLTATFSDEMDAGILTIEQMPGPRTRGAALQLALEPYAGATVTAAPARNITSARETGEDDLPWQEPPQQPPQETQQQHHSQASVIEDFVPPLKLTSPSSPRIEIYPTYSLESCATPHLRASQTDIILTNYLSQSALQEINSSLSSSSSSKHHTTAAQPPISASLSSSSLSQFPLLSSLRCTILERMSPKSSAAEEKSYSGSSGSPRFSFLTKLRKLSSSSKKDFLLEACSEEQQLRYLQFQQLTQQQQQVLQLTPKRRGSYRSYFHQKSTSTMMTIAKMTKQRSDSEMKELNRTAAGGSTRAAIGQKTEFEEMDNDDESVMTNPNKTKPTLTRVTI